ncbi:MAG TPA: PIN domain-containing protein [Verrucomicrobiae bacterium]|nr:PIN domain-containing protein [Verrucomicrobiae bacterium]
MITILDAFAVIATLVGEPAAGDVEALLRSPDADARITAVNLAEVIDRLVRTGGVAGPAVAESLSSLEDGGLVVVSVDAALGRAAGALRARHYRRRDSAVSLADCVALAAARIVNGALATSDPALARAARLDGVGVLALPDSLGIRP